jgi:hypothetical protein
MPMLNCFSSKTSPPFLLCLSLLWISKKDAGFLEACTALLLASLQESMMTNPGSKYSGKKQTWPPKLFFSEKTV